MKRVTLKRETIEAMIMFSYKCERYELTQELLNFMKEMFLHGESYELIHEPENETEPKLRLLGHGVVKGPSRGELL